MFLWLVLTIGQPLQKIYTNQWPLRTIKNGNLFAVKMSVAVSTVQVGLDVAGQDEL